MPKHNVVNIADLLNAQNRPLQYQDVPTPELGENATMRVRVLPGTARDDFDAEWLAQRDAQQQLSKGGKLPKPSLSLKYVLLSKALIDATGACLFTSAEHAAEVLGQLPSTITIRLFDAAADLNGLSEKGQAGLEKN